MSYLYNTQDEIASKISHFLCKVDPNIRKTQTNIIPYITLGMINSSSVVTSNIAKSLKGDFSLIKLDSVSRRIRRLFNNKYFDPYSFYEKIIKYVISNYKLKHKKVHIIFDHMYSKDNYTIFFFSLRIGKQGIPLFFRCFKSIRDPNAFYDDTIVKCIKIVSSYFDNTDFKLVFLADRWFNSKRILNTISSLGHTYVIRIKGNLKVKVFDKKEGHYIYKYAQNLISRKYKGTYYNKVFLYENSSFITDIVISRNNDIKEPWILVTNGCVRDAVRDYSHRFGGVESLFKNQKSNCFHLEDISNASLKAFTSMYSIMCFAYLFLFILGCDYSKNTKCYKNVKIETHKVYKDGGKKRIVSLFRVGFLLFSIAYNSPKYIRIPTSFILYDV